MDKIVAHAQSLPRFRGEVYGRERRVDRDFREAMLSHIYPHTGMDWVFDRVARVVAEVNYRHFRYDLSGMYEPLQYSEYSAPDEDGKPGQFMWHRDDGIAIPLRKLTFTMQLSHPDEYEGGDFELDWVKLPENARQRGVIHLFASSQFHRIVPVTKGMRKSLTVWIHGPVFR